MNSNMFIAGVIGIGPALALMYFTLRDYTYPKVEKPFFDDRKVFGLLALGMVMGVALFAVQQYFPIEQVLYALLFALIYELAKLAVLNLKRFSRRLDTAFYGLVIGLGMGSTVAFGYIWSSFLSFSAAGLSLGLRDYVVIIVLSFQLSLLNGSTGAVIGIGVTRGHPFGFLANAALTHIAYNFVMIGFFLYPLDVWGYVCLVFATAIAAFSYYRVHFQAIPALVEEGLAKYKSKSKA
ncbi:MAG: hypothetical protein QW520_08830 [Methanomassiliicoccales archaeon]